MVNILPQIVFNSKTIPMQVKYSINDLSRLTGIKAHTIRIWEQRFNLLTPERGGRNIRFYSNEELKKLLNVNSLYNGGHKISEIAQLTEEEVKSKLTKITDSSANKSSDYINMLILAMIDINEEKFDKAVNEAVLHSNFETCVEEVIFPFLRKIGIMWQAGDVNPAQEHFIANLIRQKFILHTALLPAIDNTQPIKYLLYLPEGEWHELSLLYYTYLVKKMGAKYLYLGQSVPFDDLAIIAEQIKPQFIITILTSPIADISTEQYLNKIASTFAHTNFLISGFQVMKDKITVPKSIKLFKDSKEFYDLL